MSVAAEVAVEFREEVGAPLLAGELVGPTEVLAVPLLSSEAVGLTEVVGVPVLLRD